MPRVFLTPLMIAGLLFLPSCSQSAKEEPITNVISECADAKQTSNNYFKEYEIQWSKRAKEISDFNKFGKSYSWEQYEKAAIKEAEKGWRVMVSYPDCFTVKEVIEAQTNLNSIYD